MRTHTAGTTVTTTSTRVSMSMDTPITGMPSTTISTKDMPSTNMDIMGSLDTLISTRASRNTSMDIAGTLDMTMDMRDIISMDMSTMVVIIMDMTTMGSLDTAMSIKVNKGNLGGGFEDLTVKILSLTKDFFEILVLKILTIIFGRWARKCNQSKRYIN